MAVPMGDDGCQSSVRPSKLTQQPSCPFSQDPEPEAVPLADGVRYPIRWWPSAMSQPRRPRCDRAMQSSELLGQHKPRGHAQSRSQREGLMFRHEDVDGPIVAV